MNSKISTENDLKKKIWPVFKWILCLAVLLFVVKRAWDLWNSSPDQVLELHYQWLLLSGIVYLVGWIPSVWFYRMLLFRAGGKINALETARSYYCGHLGKYIPGKALVLVIRAALVRHSGVAGRVAGLMAAYETLVMMGAGAALSVALIPFFLTPESTEHLPEFFNRILTTKPVPSLLESPVALPVIVILISLILLPAISKLFSFAAGKMAGTLNTESETMTEIQIETRFLFYGLVVFVLSWFLMGTSLGLVLKGVGVNNAVWSDLPAWTGIVSLATVIGFVAVFAPGGVGVREGILIGLLTLQPAVGDKSAVAAAFLLRVVWLLAEVLIAVILYLWAKPSNNPEIGSSPD